MSRPSTSRGLESDEESQEQASSFATKSWKGNPSRLAAGSVISAADSNTGSTVVSVKSLRRPEAIAEIPVLSEEQKLRAMLGFKDEDANKKSIFLREDFCGACGVQHSNPAVTDFPHHKQLDTCDEHFAIPALTIRSRVPNIQNYIYQLLDVYPLCEACLNCLREQSHLRDRYAGVYQETPLEILFATYGDVKDARKAINITDSLQAYVNSYACADRLIFRETQRFDRIFGKDPSFDKPKQVRMRYRINGVHGFIILDIMENNQIPEQIMLFCPTRRDLTILRGAYGHPKGRTTTGRMSYDVREQLQGIVDLNRGSFLYIGAMQPIERQFGDPCVGYVKDLQVEFDIDGKNGYVEMGECNNRLKRTIHIQTAPSVSPMILVNTANYGLTENSIKDRLKFLESSIAKIELIVHRRSVGLPVKVADRQFVKHREAFLAERADLKNAEPKSIDIRSKIQLIIGKQGGFELKLNKDDFDPNFTFGNPMPGRVKLLEISVTCYGHDSEQRTDGKEVTSKGYLRNFILGKKARYLVSVADDKNGRGVMQETIHFETLNVLPLMHVEKALYGHPTNIAKQFDITSTIQNMVNGKTLEINTDLDLAKTFGDPCLGVRKALKIFYCTRGFQGAVRVREKDGCLVAAVEIGFEPDIGSDAPPEQKRPIIGVSVS